ncbi:MAG: D-amino-acid transaminase [Alphaproteobacteria bacterium]|nr:D-amino-acid transaminase [Alphaproteobacteria bacterium]
MPRIAYVNGRYVPFAEARVHVEDRGYQFADAVYEVCALRGGALLDEEAHLARLGRSLEALKISWPVAPRVLGHIMRETARRNGMRDGLVYVQVSRGVAPRDHPPPKDAVKPALVVTVRRADKARSERLLGNGISVVTLPDIRWGRCDIKSTALLANVMAIAEARTRGADDAWLVDERGFVTESTRANAWIVDAKGALRTRSLDEHILHGITRAVLLEVAGRAGHDVQESAFTVSDAEQAREAFVSASSLFVTPVVRVNSHAIGDGKPGKVARELRKRYLELQGAAAKLEKF